MRRTPLILVAACLACAAASAALADVVYLKNGRKFEGTVEEKDGNVIVRLERGSMTFAKADVDRVEKSAPPWEEYEARARALKREDVSGHMELARWCKERKLDRQMRLELEQVVVADPENVEARGLLGHKRVGDKWLTPEEQKAGEPAGGPTGSPGGTPPGGAGSDPKLPGDGAFRGKSRGYADDVEVEVVVTLGKIAEVKVVEQKESNKKAAVAVKTLPERIGERQSIKVDGVSGATVTSNAIKRAAAAALASSRPLALAAVPDGTYTGMSRGLRGDISVQVVVKGGAIAEAGVTSHRETDAAAIAAVKEVPGRIKAAQSTQVEATADAAVVSQAIMRAAQSALENAVPRNWNKLPGR